MIARGQVSIELMLLVMVMLLYLQTNVQPLVLLSTQAASDVTAVGKARLAFDAVHGAALQVARSSGDSRRVLDVFIPAHAILSCDASARSLSFTVTLEAGLETLEACRADRDGDSTRCSFARAFPEGLLLRCGSGQLSWQGPGWKTVSIEKTGGVVSLA